MFWRRFPVPSIPLTPPSSFDRWLRDRWQEKENLIEHYVQNGRFPADEGHDSEGEPAANGTDAAMNGGGGVQVKQGCGFIETEVKLAHWYEISHIFAVLASFAFIAFVMAMAWNRAFYGSFFRKG